MKRLLFAVCFLVVAAVPASAQTLAINPNTVSFTASADHSTLGLDGNAMVTDYQLKVYLSTDVALATVIATLDLGKPTPDGTNTITVTNVLWFAALTPKTKFVATATAIGPSGQGVSLPSNPFGNQGPPAAAGTPLVSKK